MDSRGYSLQCCSRCDATKCADDYLLTGDDIAAVYSSGRASRKFPALFYNAKSPHTLLYFHGLTTFPEVKKKYSCAGNSADLGDIHEEMELLHRYAGLEGRELSTDNLFITIKIAQCSIMSGCSILAIEFPG